MGLFVYDGGLFVCYGGLMTISNQERRWTDLVWGKVDRFGGFWVSGTDFGGSEGHVRIKGAGNPGVMGEQETRWIFINILISPLATSVISVYWLT